MQMKHLLILESKSRISFRLATSIIEQHVYSVSGTLRSTLSMQVGVFTFSSRTEILQVMNSIRILIICNSHAKLASASVSHSKHYTACLEKSMPRHMDIHWFLWVKHFTSTKCRNFNHHVVTARCMEEGWENRLALAIRTHPSADR
jgi:hypothetical protein